MVGKLSIRNCVGVGGAKSDSTRAVKSPNLDKELRRGVMGGRHPEVNGIFASVQLH